MKNAAFILFCFLFLSAYSIGQELYPYRDSGGKYGYKEKSGKIIIPANYDRAWNFSEGLAVVEVDGKRGFIDTTGKMAIPAGFDVAGSFSQGLASVKIDGKWGLIDKSGELVISCGFDNVWSFSRGQA